MLGNVYFDETSLIVHPDHIVEPPEVKPPTIIRDGDEDYDGGKVSGGQVEPRKKVLSRYYGRVGIDARRVNKDIGLIVEEVIERLTSQVSCEVEITLEISAWRAEGFDENTSAPSAKTAGRSSSSIMGLRRGDFIGQKSVSTQLNCCIIVDDGW